jgi:hypothetical protein
MNKVMKTIFGLTIVAGIMMLMMSMDKPTIKRLSTFRGEHIPSFAEFRVQQIEYDDLGVMMLTGAEPYEMLVNTTYVTAVYRYEDAKKTDYSTLMFLNYQQDPILIRQPYKDVVSSIRKSQEAMVK